MRQAAHLDELKLCGMKHMIQGKPDEKIIRMIGVEYASSDSRIEQTNYFLK